MTSLLPASHCCRGLRMLQSTEYSAGFWWHGVAEWRGVAGWCGVAGVLYYVVGAGRFLWPFPPCILISFSAAQEAPQHTLIYSFQHSFKVCAGAWGDSSGVEVFLCKTGDLNSLKPCVVVRHPYNLGTGEFPTEGFPGHAGQLA